MHSGETCRGAAGGLPGAGRKSSKHCGIYLGSGLYTSMLRINNHYWMQPAVATYDREKDIDCGVDPRDRSDKGA